MNETRMKKLAERIQELASALEDIPKGAMSADCTYFIGLGPPKRLSVDATVQHYYPLLREFFKVKLFDSKISVRLLQALIEKLLADYLARPHTLNETMELVEELEAQAISKVDRWHYYMAVEGLAVETSDIQFGKHVLMQMDAENASKLKQQYFEIIEQMPVANDVKQRHKESVELQFKSATDLIGRACIRLEIEGDQDRVKEDALKTALPILHVLTFAAQGHFWSSRKVRIGFGAPFTEQMRNLPIVSTDVKKAGWSKTWHDGRQHLKIDSDALEGLRKHGLDSLTEMFTRKDPPLTEVERAILRAAKSFYNGYNEADSINEFVSYVMIMECLLSPSDKDQLTKTISEAAAILLEDTPERRLELCQYVKKLYSDRGAIVHGKTDKISPNRVLDARGLAFRLIELALARRESWKKLKDIQDEVDRIKFS